MNKLQEILDELVTRRVVEFAENLKERLVNGLPRDASWLVKEVDSEITAQLTQEKKDGE